jgi:hypothetical protein
MDAPKRNKFAMAQAVNVVLTEKDYQPLWQSTPGFVKLQASLATEIGTSPVPTPVTTTK